ncbi:uncharacterized protein LOC116057094 [Sander lucioperca]|uniref:uncharacterized protein LOC116057094 n=1 Tax=Sander lucioperca TaxID=283035 RepID=UPI00125D9685|nr:uncharacterized protein LOC116057094 [Sander lucioperca]
MAPLTWTGARGLPQYAITRGQLEFLMSCGFRPSQMAEILNVSLKTVKRHLRRFNLSRSTSYSDVTDVNLDAMIQDLVGGNEQLGPESVHAQLRAEGVRIQRRRVRESMVRINPRAAALRAMSQRLHRRSYWVAGPNSLWHIDGNHKLIRWRIVVHGSIDGYSRLIVFLRASNNNRSSTVLECFMSAVAKYGVPSRVLTDHGGENNDVCLLMNVFRGSGRGSAIRGTSTHNQRIERLWGDMWRGVINVYHDLFRFLEREGIVDPDNEMHLWALQYVYLPRINRDLNAFTNQWNHHGLRTERHQSPLQIFVRGCLAQQRQPTTAIRDLFATESSEVAGETDGTAGAMDGGRAEAAGTGDAAAAGKPPDIDWPERVQVPQTRFTLGAVMSQQLEEQFDPLGGQRVNLGIEIIRDLITYLESRNIY